jgi:NAD(P)-dependent dehydrogenase (short-subunit alcohol dehydrogenase family)
LAEDVREFGIKVTVVAPGAFRTSFLTPESLTIAKNPMEEYKAVRASHDRYLQMDGQQAGDPEKAASSNYQRSLPGKPATTFTIRRRCLRPRDGTVGKAGKRVPF